MGGRRGDHRTWGCGTWLWIACMSIVFYLVLMYGMVQCTALMLTPTST